MFFVYILQSKASGKYYIGSCEDFEKRFNQHNSGRGKSTKAFRPWVVLYTETCATRIEAREREQQLKKWKSRTAIETLIAKHF